MLVVSIEDNLRMETHVKVWIVYTVWLRNTLYDYMFKNKYYVYWHKAVEERGNSRSELERRATGWRKAAEEGDVAQPVMYDKT